MMFDYRTAMIEEIIFGKIERYRPVFQIFIQLIPSVTIPDHIHQMWLDVANGKDNTHIYDEMFEFLTDEQLLTVYRTFIKHWYSNLQ